MTNRVPLQEGDICIAKDRRGAQVRVMLVAPTPEIPGFFSQGWECVDDDGQDLWFMTVSLRRETAE